MFGFAKQIAAIATLVGLVAQPALAQDTLTATASRTAQIDVSKVNLDSDREWNRIAETIRTQAADICERTVGESDRRDADVEECTQASYEQGVKQMRTILARRTLVSQTRLARS